MSVALVLATGLLDGFSVRLDLELTPPYLRGVLTNFCEDITGKAPESLGTYPPVAGAQKVECAKSPNGAVTHLSLIGWEKANILGFVESYGAPGYPVGPVAVAEDKLIPTGGAQSSLLPSPSPPRSGLR